jgi:hypothetical protein
MVGFGKIAVSLEMISDSITNYNAYLSACKSAIVDPELTCRIEGEISLADGRKFAPGKRFNTGDLSDGYLLGNAADLIVSYRSSDVCKEKAALQLMNSVDMFPDLAPIVSGIPVGCESKIIAVERMGDGTWGDTVDSVDKSFFIRLARFFIVLRALHESGLVHGRLTTKNVAVKADDPHYVALINLRQVQPYMNVRTQSHYLVGSRTDDLKTFVASLMPDAHDPPVWYKILRDWVARIPPHERPPYERWIRMYFDKAEEMEF